MYIYWVLQICEGSHFNTLYGPSQTKVKRSPEEKGLKGKNVQAPWHGCMHACFLLLRGVLVLHALLCPTCDIKLPRRPLLLVSRNFRLWILTFWQRSRWSANTNQTGSPWLDRAEFSFIGTAQLNNSATEHLLNEKDKGICFYPLLIFILLCPLAKYLL